MRHCNAEGFKPMTFVFGEVIIHDSFQAPTNCSMVLVVSNYALVY